MIERVHVPLLDKTLLVRMAWQRWLLPWHLNKQKCGALFSPGGISPKHVLIPSIVMSQNLLPFEPKERDRFVAHSFMRFKIRLIEQNQRRSMEQANGLIFLTNYARDIVTTALKCRPKRLAVIPHGIEQRFFSPPRRACPVSEFTKTRPFHLLYVSIVDVYKHQWQVAEAVVVLHGKGVPVEIDFIGPAYGPAMKLLNAVIKRHDVSGEFLHYRGPLPFSELHKVYRKADGFIFASSCENLPVILLEAMAAGLPIACSRRGPMPEILGDAGIYFDPERPEEITAALSELINQAELRRQLAERAFQYAKSYSWERCADETFLYISEVAHKGKV
jgi:glycosyltransferase involved in cell wall biosynthesis